MSNQRIISYDLDDLVVDPEGVIESINDACTHRHDHYRVSGVCQIEHTVYFALVPLTGKEKLRPYILVTVDDTSHDGFVAMLNNRWSSGFDVIGLVQMYDTTMALFAKPTE